MVSREMKKKNNPETQAIDFIFKITEVFEKAVQTKKPQAFVVPTPDNGDFTIIIAPNDVIKNSFWTDKTRNIRLGRMPKVEKRH